MSDLRTSLGIPECEAAVLYRVNLENKIQSLKILDYLLRDSKMLIIMYVVIWRATHPQEVLFTYATEMCVVCAVPKPVQTKPTLRTLTTEM